MTLMSITILFTNAKVWKESKCQSMDECIKMCMHQFIFRPILYEGSLFSIFSPTFVTVLLDGSLWQLWSDISFYFWLAFLWWLAILSILSCACWSFAFHFWKYIYSFFFFAHFFIGLLVVLMMFYELFIYMFDANSLSVMSFANIFSHSVGCLFVYGLVFCAKAF